MFANLVLWNGAVMRPQQYKDLFYDIDKLNSYVNNALIPMVQVRREKTSPYKWPRMTQLQNGTGGGTVSVKGGDWGSIS